MRRPGSALGSSSRPATRSTPRAPDGGEATAQFVVLVPVLVLFVMLVVQAALWFHSANVAQAGAARGAGAGAPLTASADTAATAAATTVGENGGRLVRWPSVVSTARLIDVTVELAVPRVVPFFPATVSRTQSEPRERFIPENER